MKRVLVVGVLVVVGCNKPASTSAKADPQFDARWQQATSTAEPAYIESQRGGGLLGEVRRAVDPPPPSSVGEVVQGTLPDPVVAGVIKRNLPAVKGCYEIEERAGTVGSGKAIVTIDIDPSGTVHNVSVDAPAFAASNLPACLSARARAWTFPKFTAGSKKFSYPFVFVGG